MNANGEYKHLAPRYGSSYKQWFIKGKRTRAEVVYSSTLEPNSLTPEQAAKEFRIPVEAVQECIDYCMKNKELLDAEWAAGEAEIKRLGLDKPPFVPVADRPES